MKKLMEYQDEEALDLLADLIEPASSILTDKEVAKAFKSRKRSKCISLAIKKHKREVFEVLARLEGVSVKDYHCNILTLPKTLLEILNDKELLDFFKSQSQKMEEEPSGSATETSKVEG